MIAVVLSLSAVLIIGTHFSQTASQYLEKQLTLLEEKQFSQVITNMTEELNTMQTYVTLAAEELEYQQKRTANEETPQKGNSTAFSSILQILESNGVFTTNHYKLQLFNPVFRFLICYTDYSTFVSHSSYNYLSGIPLTELENHFGWTGQDLHLFFPGDPVYETTHNDLFSIYEKSILFAQPFFSSSNSTSMLCAIVSPELLSEAVPDGMAIAILRENGNVLVNHTEYSNIDLQTIATNPELTASNHFANLQDYGLQVMYFPDALVLQNEVLALRIAYILSGILLISVAFLTAHFLINPLTRPLRDLEARLSRINDQNSLCAAKVRPHFASRNHIFIYLFSISFSTSLLFSVFAYSYFRSSSRDLLSSSLDVSFQQAIDETEMLFDNYQNISLYMAFDEQLQTALAADKELSLENSEQLDSFFKNLQFMYNSPLELQLYNSKQEMIVSTNYIYPNLSALPTLPKRQIQWTTQPFRGRTAMLMYMSIIDLYSYKTIGYLTLHVDELYIAHAYDFFPTEECAVFLHTTDGSVLSSSDKSIIGNQIPSAKENEIQLTHNLQNTDLALTVYCQPSVLDQDLGVTVRSLSYLLLVLLAAILLITQLLSHYFLLQFRMLSNTLSHFSVQNTQEFQSRTSIILEVNRTYAAFEEMAQRIQHLLNDILRAEERRHALELEKRHSELLLLQSQINPHFLYNTFETINNLIYGNDPKNATAMITTLADMLRFTAKKNTLIVPVEEELRYAQMYMNIMKLHYADLITASFSFSEEALHNSTAKFILQPILENAIYHGLKPKGGVGAIRITGMVANQKLIIIVRDDGVGISKQKLLQINETLDNQNNQDSIGLPNIANRLRLIHGDDAKIIVGSNEGEGCVVTIIQPILQ